jgi:hypothetical protein
MSIDKTRLFNSTVEGKKHKCPKCKRQSYVIEIQLIQVKKGKYEIIIKKRCSFDCPEAVDHKYKLTLIKEKDIVEEIVEEIIKEEQKEHDKELLAELNDSEEVSEEMLRNELEHEAQYDEYEAPDDPPEEEVSDEPIKIDF